MKKRVGIIGAGVVGTAMGVILSRQGWEVTGVYDLRPESTRFLAQEVGARIGSSPTEVSRSADVVLVTTSDSAIEGVVRGIAKEGGFREGQFVAHMSGALSSDVLWAAREQGAITLSVHPVQSFASVERALQNLPGSVFSIEGDERGFELAAEVVRTLGGEFFFIDKKAKPLYHASACVVSNYLVTLVDFGLQLMEQAGIPRESAHRALLPLIEGTVNNIVNIGIPGALTGPIARGDVATVTRHLDSIRGMMPEWLGFYRVVGYHTVDVARAKGTIDEETALTLKNLLGS